MSATADDLIKAARGAIDVSIDGIPEPVAITSMTVDQALKFGELAKKSNDNILLYAALIKLCCPAFQSWRWTPRRIKKKLSLKVMLLIADKIMEVSGYRAEAIPEAVKD